VVVSSEGGRSPSGSSIITFADVNVDPELTDDQHRALLIYFLSLLMSDLWLVCAIIIIVTSVVISLSQLR